MSLDREIRDEVCASGAEENDLCKESSLTRELESIRERSVEEAISRYGFVTPVKLYMLDRDKYYDCCTLFPKH